MTSPAPRRITAKPGTRLHFQVEGIPLVTVEIVRIRDSRAQVVLYMEPTTEFVREEAN